MDSAKSISKREKILLLVTLSVALIAGIVYWYRPQRQQWYEAQTKIAELQEEIKKTKVELHSLGQARALASSSDASWASEVIQKNSSLPSFVEELTHRAQESSFDLKRIELKTQQVANDVVQSDFSLFAEASFSQLGSYLEALENSPFIVQVNAVEIFRKNSDLRKITTQLNMSTFHVLYEEGP